ncbi:hypothetical protein GCM10025865_19030 [Paraoerskovia sediminicola]|uniref:DUF3180 domain-containing protein n=1 Tax=Paraoerskovia sediminicola TaxID=1138587 RepID=A0ABN6XCJ5_9CELL|nr:DUF3180 domain-containing protein [Paraoerskovia sediminicola]BDZ42604.1 hypothetical protein GCM10025865_19030 [Paraoerskovia sediminicola]
MSDPAVRPTRVRTLVLVAVASTVLSGIVARLLEDAGVFLAAVPWPVDVALLLLAGAVLWAGSTVRSYLRGNRPGLSGLRAARTLVLAKSAALAGSLLVGWYGGQALVLMGEAGIEARRDKAIAAGVAVLCSVVLAIAGLVAERFCRLPPQDGDPRSGADAPGEEARRDEGPEEEGLPA